MSNEDKARLQQYEENRKRKLDLEKLLESNGWKDFKRTVEEQIRLRRQDSFSRRVTDLSEAFKEADCKGEIAGLQLALTLPLIVLGDLEADIQIFLELRRQEEEENKDKE